MLSELYPCSYLFREWNSVKRAPVVANSLVPEHSLLPDLQQQPRVKVGHLAETIHIKDLLNNFYPWKISRGLLQCQTSIGTPRGKSELKTNSSRRWSPIYWFERLILLSIWQGKQYDAHLYSHSEILKVKFCCTCIIRVERLKLCKIAIYARKRFRDTTE